MRGERRNGGRRAVRGASIANYELRITEDRKSRGTWTTGAVRINPRVPMRHSKFVIRNLLSLFAIGVLLSLSSVQATDCFPLARLRYSGGGDWYAGPSMLPNLAARLRAEDGVDVCPDERTVDPLSASPRETPILFMTGHGRVAFSGEERRALRDFLRRGGLLFADDNYGMAPSFRAEMDTLFPNHPLRPLPPSHPIFSARHEFPRGLPKIHRHDGGAPVAYGIERDGRILVLFTHEADLGNGWEDAAVHDVPAALREQALRFGVNVHAWFLEGARAR